MVSCIRLVFAFVLLSLTPTFAISQDKSDSYLDEQIQKRIDEIEKNLTEVKELIKLRIADPKAVSWDTFGITGKTVSVDLPNESYTGGVEITKIEPDSHAEATGLDVGDVIVVFGGSKAPTLEDLVSAVEKLSSQGTRFPKIVFIRDGKQFVTSRLLRFAKK